MSNVLMVCKAYPPVTGGVETFSEQVARAYLRRGLRVTVVTQTTGGAGWHIRTYSEGSTPVFNTGPGGQLATAFRMFKAVLTLTRVESFDFLHATTWRPAIPLVLLSLPEPLVVSVHGREILIVPGFLRPFMRLVFRKAAAVVCVSSATQTRALERLGQMVNPTNWLVAHNGLSFVDDDSDFAGRSRFVHRSDNVHFLTLARLVERKNVQGCIRAFQALKNAGFSNFEYRIAGTGPLAAELQSQVHSAGLDEHVRFLGYVPDSGVPSLYEWADVFLHPQIDLHDSSDFEGFGLSIADSMSYGCLAIAGIGSGPSDFIQDGATGLLVDGTDQQQLTDAIREVLDDLDKFGSIADSGQLYVRSELSWDKHIDSVLSALKPDQDVH